jgi:hypothetical protein
LLNKRGSRQLPEHWKAVAGRSSGSEGEVVGTRVASSATDGMLVG